VKYLSNWQPLVNEDRHTALLFGFMRHAPIDALNSWLSSILDRPVEATPLGQHAFWPNLPSVMPGSVITQPELVFDADDGSPVTVVVEVKPGYDMLELGQICREVVDVANARSALRVSCVMVGADLNPPMDLGMWRKAVAQSLRENLPEHAVEAELAYASFASLGRAARDFAASKPEWSAYAEDVLAQLRQKGLLGYDGAPMFDDLGELTIPHAVEAFNRSIRAAREFFLQLHGQPSFINLGLRPYWKEHRMVRNGGSQTPTQPVEWFETTVVMCLYKRERWQANCAVFVCFDLLGHDGEHPDLCAGACEVREGNGSYAFARAERVPELTSPAREATDDMLPEALAEPGSQWRLDRIEWKPGQADEDIDWTVTRLQHAIKIWDAAVENHGSSEDASPSHQSI
jgi:hypothetical protein